MKISTIKIQPDVLHETEDAITVVYLSKGYLEKVYKAFQEKDNNDNDRRNIGYRVFSALNPDYRLYFPNEEGNKVRIAVNEIITALNFLNTEIESLSEAERRFFEKSHWYRKYGFDNLLDVLEFASNYRTTLHKHDSIGDYKIVAAELDILRAAYHLQNEPVPIRLYGPIDMIFRSLVKIIKEVKNIKV